jgi:hypothetical protein
MHLSSGRIGYVLSRLTLVLSVVLAGIVAPIAFAPTASAGATYGLATTHEVDTPDRTVTVDGEEYLVDAVGRVDVGETMAVDVTAAADEPVDVYLYNSDRDILAVRSETGNGSVTFETADRAPGSYVLTLVNESGTVEAILPVVVAGWDTSLAVPDATEESSVTATVSIDPLVTMPRPESVTVVVSRNGSIVDQYDADRTGDGQYAVDLPADHASEEHTAYAAVRNVTTVEGRHELVGLSETYEFDRTDGTDETDSTGGTDGTDETDSTDGTDGTDTTTTPATVTPNGTTGPATVTPDATVTATPASETTGSPSPVASPSTATPSPDGSSSELITASTATPAPATSTPVPGFGLLVAFVSLAAAGVLLARRRR